MTLESIVTTFGYPAIFIGTAFEGETIAVLGGFLSHRGYLTLPATMLVAFAGSFTGDQVCFALGRLHGRAMIERRPRWRKRAHAVRELIERHETIVLLGFRFVLGARMMTPLLLGSTGFSGLRFLVYNAIGAAVWAGLFTALGYLFGHTAELALQHVRAHELRLVALLICVGLGLWAHHRRRPAGG